MKILIVENDPLHRSFMAEVVKAALPECEQMLEAEDGLQGERIARQSKVDNIVMDLEMSPRNGIEAARALWHSHPETRILFWSNYADEANVRGISKIVPAGAVYGYLLKSASVDRLKLVLRSVFIEEQCVVDRQIRTLHRRGADTVSGLTDSEYEVLVDIAIGLTDRAIAQRHRMSLRSVQGRLQALCEKLGVQQVSTDSGDAIYNLRARAVLAAMTGRILNLNTIERANADLLARMRL